MLSAGVEARFFPPVSRLTVCSQSLADINFREMQSLLDLPRSFKFLRQTLLPLSLRHHTRV